MLDFEKMLAKTPKALAREKMLKLKDGNDHLIIGNECAYTRYIKLRPIIQS